MAGTLTEAVAASNRGRASTAVMLNDDDRATPLTDALLDAVSLFRELDLRYALVGGLAAMVHGRARYTEDVDFVAERHYEQVLANHPAAMKRHGFDPSCTWKLYHDSGIEIDLWKDKHADAIAERAVHRKLAGKMVRVADPHDLIAMKLRSGRARDSADIVAILKTGRIRIDKRKLTPRLTAQQRNRLAELEDQAARESG